MIGKHRCKCDELRQAILCCVRGQIRALMTLPGGDAVKERGSSRDGRVAAPSAGPLDRPVDRRAGDGQQFGQLGAGLGSGVVERDEVGFLAGAELRLLAP